MLLLQVDSLFELSRSLEASATILRGVDQDAFITQEVRARMLQRLPLLRDSCRALFLTITARSIEDALAGTFQQGTNKTAGELLTEVTFLQRTLKNELRDREFVFVTPHLAPYLTVEIPFGAPTAGAFPGTIDDMVEAARCLALSRNTACVFHLARMMESALRGLAVALHLDMHTPSWDAALGKIDTELKRRYEKGLTWSAEEAQFFGEAAADLRAVQRAWRNPTMHVGHRYDEEQATAIYAAVRSFMQHLAIRIGEA